MRVYESVGSSLMVNEWMWKRMIVNEPIWGYMKVIDSMNVNGNKSVYMKAYEAIFW